MELKWLEDFLSLAENRSFSRAAEMRNVTQPAFSRRIRSLEIWLGCELFNRTSYPVSLTQEGRAFLETAEETVRQLYQSKANLQGRGFGQLPQASFALTALHTLTTTFLPRWLTVLRERIGPVGSRVLPENFLLCLQALAEGGYDFFLTFHHPSVPLPLDPQRFPHATIGQDRLVAVAQTGRLAEWQAANPTLPMLQYSRGSFLGLLTTVAQSQPGAPATHVVHVNENSIAEAMRSMVLEGHGVAWLPQALIAGDIAAGRLEVVAPGLPMEIRLYRNAERARPIVEKVWTAAQGMADPYADPA
ncbi:LysR family transcriptional regulator [Xinfangfangia sp. D13-10-4-6]|uniref:LysR family transcriptional regulator n=1 Tax=Pseudogemmobacter hezensis TaxID=2737662 RepID=UPI00155289F1|nr:LysR family transcriptional regulator [Pseudogemmobacter hezensis]NPD16724.1 LysR family transcriptional regulator [Pseudogemmobacter hezensis]